MQERKPQRRHPQISLGRDRGEVEKCSWRYATFR